MHPVVSPSLHPVGIWASLSARWNVIEAHFLTSQRLSASTSEAEKAENRSTAAALKPILETSRGVQKQRSYESFANYALVSISGGHEWLHQARQLLVP